MVPPTPTQKILIPWFTKLKLTQHGSLINPLWYFSNLNFLKTIFPPKKCTCPQGKQRPISKSHFFIHQWQCPLKPKALTGRGEPKAATEKEGLFLGNEYGCGRDSDNGLNSCGLDVVAAPDVEASVSYNGSPNIDVLGLLLSPEVENKPGVEVLIESDLLMSCLLVCTIERSSSCKGWK